MHKTFTTKKCILNCVTQVWRFKYKRDWYETRQQSWSQIYI